MNVKVENLKILKKKIFSPQYFDGDKSTYIPELKQKWKCSCIGDWGPPLLAWKFWAPDSQINSPYLPSLHHNFTITSFVCFSFTPGLSYYPLNSPNLHRGLFCHDQMSLCKFLAFFNLWRNLQLFFRHHWALTRKQKFKLRKNCFDDMCSDMWITCLNCP